jgi:hypothetical protein
MLTQLLGIIRVDFNRIHQLLIRVFALVRYWTKNDSRAGWYINYLPISRKPTVHSEEKYCTVFSFNSE